MKKRLEALEYLAAVIKKNGEGIQSAIQKTYAANRWLIPENCAQALDAICMEMLDPEKIKTWLAPYNLNPTQTPKKVGLVMAGNIPLVGFHDWLAVFVAGHHAKIKLSSKDEFLLPYLFEELSAAFPEFKAQTEFVERLNDVDAIIATGSDNSARYFEYYFKKYPNIIRKNRNGIAVLDGTETREELLELGVDIFKYFGLGCRSISKIFVPEGYDFPNLMETLHEFNQIVLNNKYKNNFDHHRTVFLLNSVPHFINGSVIVREDKSYSSGIATLHYEYYNSKSELEKLLVEDAEKIQCITSNIEFEKLKVIPLGTAQQPGLSDYADAVDTIQFLQSLS